MVQPLGLAFYKHTTLSHFWAVTFASPSTWMPFLGSQIAAQMFKTQRDLSHQKCPPLVPVCHIFLSTSCHACVILWNCLTSLFIGTKAPWEWGLAYLPKRCLQNLAECLAYKERMGTLLLLRWGCRRREQVYKRINRSFLDQYVWLASGKACASFRRLDHPRSSHSAT